MTAAALLVVLGAAFAMEIGGLSMAMGAFLAGVLLSESSFRNQLEADIEPFRGLLLGLFFLGVGMSLDLRLIAEAWRSVIGLVVVFVTVKAAGIYVAARIFDSAPARRVAARAPAWRRAASSPSFSMPRRSAPASSARRPPRS